MTRCDYHPRPDEVIGKWIILYRQGRYHLIVQARYYGTATEIRTGCGHVSAAYEAGVVDQPAGVVCRICARTKLP